MWNYVEINC